MKLLITGGAGFIGSAVVRQLMAVNEHEVLVLDALTYAGNLESLPGYDQQPKVSFTQVDLREAEATRRAVLDFAPDIIMHLAAESHVDRSIDGPREFLDTNITGTFNLLQAAREHYSRLEAEARKQFRFHHISTDEVYGDLAPEDPPFNEASPYAPSSPYSASKAASDHLVRAWCRTYGLPVVVSNCSNNYGPYQFPEKLIPHMILNALAGKPLPVYGDGAQVRDWLYVEDHARALVLVATQARAGETYNIGGLNEVKNLKVVQAICALLEELAPDKPEGVKRYQDLIEFVDDRPGHDRRYAIDATKIREHLGWQPKESFETGLRKTLQWYLNNRGWWERVLSGEYRLARLGKV